MCTAVFGLMMQNGRRRKKQALPVVPASVSPDDLTSKFDRFKMISTFLHATHISPSPDHLSSHLAIFGDAHLGSHHSPVSPNFP